MQSGLQSALLFVLVRECWEQLEYKISGTLVWDNSPPVKSSQKWYTGKTVKISSEIWRREFLTAALGRRSKVTSSQAGTPEVTCSHPTLRLKAQLATHQRAVARYTLVREIEENGWSAKKDGIHLVQAIRMFECLFDSTWYLVNSTWFKPPE